VHTSGRKAKTSRVRGELEMRAVQTPQDHYPFVIAGRYVSTALDTPNEKVYLWTRTAQPHSEVTAASDSLVRAINAYNSAFGNRSKDARALWIVECPAAAGCFSAGVSAYANFFGDAEEPASAEMASLDTALVDFRGGVPKIGAAVAPSLAASWLGYGERARFGKIINDMVRNGAISAPVIIGRDHLDSGSVASPYRETEGMKDGSDAIADWPVLNALLNAVSGASWVSVHHGGGVGIGYSIHAGLAVLADGTAEAEARIATALTNDPGLGVARHADAGYEEAIRTAKAKGIKVPMMKD
jgi:hypothetical protein